MRVREFIERKQAAVIAVEPRDQLATAIHLLMTQTVGGLPVLDSDGSAVGFVSERDVVRAAYETRWAARTGKHVPRYFG